MEAHGIVVVYDGDCPVCSSYVRHIRLRRSVGRVSLIDARDGGTWVDRIRAAKLDLDEGMVVFYGGRFYHGADALNVMAMLSTRSGAFNSLAAAAFAKPAVARILYPGLRAGRNLLLRLLG